MPQLVLGRDLHFWLSVSGLDRLPLGRLFDVSEPGGVVDDGTYAAAMRSGRPDRRPVFSRFTESGVVWDDGREEPVDAVLLATGYGPNLGYLGPLGALRADGHPDQRAGVSRTVPGSTSSGCPSRPPSPRRPCAGSAPTPSSSSPARAARWPVA